jgi:hypothetical protein
MPPRDDTGNHEHRWQEANDCPQNLSAVTKRPTKMQSHDPGDGIVNG